MPKKETRDIQINFRITKQQQEQLEFICNAYGISRSNFFQSCITQQFDTLNGNPLFVEALETMKNFAADMQRLSGPLELKK